MNKTSLYSILIILFASINLSAQSTTGFQYQSIMRDREGNTITNHQLTVRFSIQREISNKKEVEPITLYSETHDVSTDSNGLIQLKIGTGTPVTGNFDTIDWNGKVLIKTEIDTEGKNTFTCVGTQELSNVPYAFSAETTLGLKSENGTNWNLICDNDGNLKAVPIPERFTKLVFYDEFEGTGLPDPSYWGYEEGFVRNGEEQYYTVAREENCFLKDGCLHIVCANDDAFVENALYEKQWDWQNFTGARKDSAIAITSASVITKGNFAFTYGRVEVRAKLPVCLGSWPAIWLYPQDEVYGNWPATGEIDIIEHVGYAPQNVHFTLHSNVWNGNNQPNRYGNSASINDATDWHIYALEWHPDRISWYVDGELKTTVIKGSNYTNAEWPFNVNFYLILNTAFGGGWGGREGFDATALPQTYTIDYVRIYQ